MPAKGDGVFLEQPTSRQRNFSARQIGSAARSGHPAARRLISAMRGMGLTAQQNQPATPPEDSTVQSVIEVVAGGNHVNIKWGWGGNSAYLDMCELQVDRSDGKGFVLLAYDTTPNDTDTQPIPAAPAKWTYKAIYRMADAQVGQWSLPVSVTV